MNVNFANSIPRDALPASQSGTAGSAGPAAASALPPLPAPDAAGAAAPAPTPSVQEVKQAVEQINRFMQQSNRTLQFSFDKEANRIVVKITDSQTGELIRQIPSEEVLAISRAIGDIQQGMLLRQSA